MSEPIVAAKGKHVGAVVFFSSASRNTERFIISCHLEDEGLNVYRIPLKPRDPALDVREPYVIVVPTYGGGNPKKAVPPQVRKFLNDPDNRQYIRGVIASGNTNFGDAFCAAGDIIAAKCHVPFMYYFELMGTPEDRRKVRAGLADFFAKADLQTPQPTGTPTRVINRAPATLGLLSKTPTDVPIRAVQAGQAGQAVQAGQATSTQDGV